MSKISTRVIILLTLCTALMKAELLQLNNVRFEKFKRAQRFSFILFYEPNCASCEQLFAHIEKLQERYKIEKPELKFAIVDITANQILKRNQQVTRTPAVRLYLHPEIFVPYINVTSEERFAHYIDYYTNLELNAAEIASEHEFRAYNDASLALYLSFPEVTESEIATANALQRAFPKVSIFFGKRLSQFDSLIHRDIRDNRPPSSAPMSDISKVRYLTVFKRDFDEGTAFYETHDPINYVSLIYALTSGQNPRIRTLDLEVTDLMTKQFIPTIIAFDKEFNSTFISTFESAAKELSANALLVKSDIKAVNGRTFIGMFEKDTEKLPIIGAYRVKDRRLLKYKLDSSKPTKEQIQKFIREFDADRLTPFYKNGVKVSNKNRQIASLNREQFKRLRPKPGHTIIVGFVAKWCSYCHEVETMFKDCIKAINKEKETFRFVQIDLDDNDIDDIDLSKIPVIRVWGKNDTEFQTYSGLREAEVFLDWLERKEGRVYHDKKMPTELENELKAAKNANKKKSEDGPEVITMEEYNERFGKGNGESAKPEVESATIESELERISRMSEDL